ncbi:uncharacterized protein PFL1_02439 [Pseudozyma flocculosa PF-1]|uniref:beta-N-acetylhexosaminidase n=2 Tax=Pseudozyma flocculosa TaxID=84751 RepID=A0A5C3EY73_9BASI|nr:uncharacterized protein PFL1_02439 [Pseudozyma flocculosa PF-1]EPQ29766.1 hypothetical protein PFL1_02439 [Pseudozyma flocculosa PF-1]SPO37052.1 uncharacterized protein PSFLO_02524 [Pseudozyma flocculosa]
MASTAATMMTATPSSSLPRIQVHLPADLIPDRLVLGLNQITAQQVRQATIRISNRGPIPAQGIVPPAAQPSPSSSSTSAPSSSQTPRPVPLWCWNVVFLPDTAINVKSWSTSTSSSNFAPLQDRNASSGFVQEPFIISVRYHPDRPSSAFRALGHILATTRCIATTAIASDLNSDVDDGGDDLGHGHDHAPLHPNLFAQHPIDDPTPRRWHISPSLANARLNYTETANFTTVGTMIDCSRNGVLNVASVKFLCRTLACMGYNMLQLYTEDTYKIPDEPFFGYLRGGYSDDELRSIDDYAHNLGIEVIPCIQTLGHLGQMLQWPRFLSLRDTAEVLLAEWPETYAMLEKMIAAATAPFRSRKIHLGMDETHGLAHGRYYSIFGHANGKDGSRVFAEHLQRVDAICRRMALEPMIWSDMLFCLSSRNNSLTGYYDSAKPADASVEGIPDGVDLVYWDYYHTSQRSYASRIEGHRELRGSSPWTAAGSWTWSRFWTALPFTFVTCRANLNASKQAGAGVDHVFLTTWGDEGNEVDLWSSLPAWSYYADHAYTPDDEVDVELLKARFDAVVGGQFDDFVLGSKLDEHSDDETTHPVDDRIHFAPNTSKWLLWSDPVASFVEPSAAAAGLDLERHYAWLEEALRERLEGTVVETDDREDRSDDRSRSTDDGDEGDDTMSDSSAGAPSYLTRTLSDHPFNARLMLPLLLSRVLSLKATLRTRLHRAYVAHDWPTLGHLAKRTRACLEATRRLWRYHRQVWMSLYKPQGWETLELRYGGLVARLDTLTTRVEAFLRFLDAGGEVGRPPSSGGDETDAAAGPRTDVFLVDPAAHADGQGHGHGAGEAAAEQVVYCLPELEEDLKIVYGSAEQLLDYHRVSRPTYC